MIVPLTLRAPADSPTKLIGTWAVTGRLTSAASRSTCNRSSRLGSHWISRANARWLPDSPLMVIWMGVAPPALAKTRINREAWHCKARGSIPGP